MRAVSRRAFLVALSTAVPLVAVPPSVWGDTLAARGLTFTHTHTGERLAIDYFSGGAYQPDALATINHFMRDFRTGDVRDIDPGLLDVLHGLSGLTDSSKPFQVISAYRCPATNTLLRGRSEGVASGSLHMTGQAIDIRLADVPLAKLRDAALAVRGGGVGYYPASDFVHVDTGRVRRW